MMQFITRIKELENIEMSNIFVFIYYVMKRVESYKVRRPHIRHILTIYRLYLAYTWSY